MQSYASVLMAITFSVFCAAQVQQEALAKEYANTRYEQPYQTAMYEAAMLLHHRRWHMREYEAAVGKLAAPDLEVSASCFPALFIQCARCCARARPAPPYPLCHRFPPGPYPHKQSIKGGWPHRVSLVSTHAWGHLSSAAACVCTFAHCGLCISACTHSAIQSLLRCVGPRLLAGVPEPAARALQPGGLCRWAPARRARRRCQG